MLSSNNTELKIDFTAKSKITGSQDILYLQPFGVTGMGSDALSQRMFEAVFSQAQTVFKDAEGRKTVSFVRDIWQKANFVKLIPAECSSPAK